MRHEYVRTCLWPLANAVTKSPDLRQFHARLVRGPNTVWRATSPSSCTSMLLFRQKENEGKEQRASHLAVHCTLPISASFEAVGPIVKHLQAPTGAAAPIPDPEPPSSTSSSKLRLFGYGSPEHISPPLQRRPPEGCSQPFAPRSLAILSQPMLKRSPSGRTSAPTAEEFVFHFSKHFCNCSAEVKQPRYSRGTSSALLLSIV